MGGLCSYRFYKSTSFVGGIIAVGRIRRSRHPAVPVGCRLPDGAALIRPTFLQLPHTQKSPSVRTGFFTCLMPGSLWRAS
ncbi:hypothetical protein D7J76_15215 [Salmonella enterica]|nr:hypothetical protein [Salmonella enterica]EBK5137090.1 hypothetical protein [Salmonella enterica]